MSATPRLGEPLRCALHEGWHRHILPRGVGCADDAQDLGVARGSRRPCCRNGLAAGAENPMEFRIGYHTKRRPSSLPQELVGEMLHVPRIGVKRSKPPIPIHFPALCLGIAESDKLP